MSKVPVAGYERDRVDTQRHVFQVAVTTSVSRETAMKNLAKLLDQHNQKIISCGFRPDMAVIPDE